MKPDCSELQIAINIEKYTMQMSKFTMFFQEFWLPSWILSKTKPFSEKSMTEIYFWEQICISLCVTHHFTP